MILASTDQPEREHMGLVPILSVEEEKGLVLRYGMKEYKLRTKAQMEMVLEEINWDQPCLVSSSVDHAEEYTEDSEIIELCRDIRREW